MTAIKLVALSLLIGRLITAAFIFVVLMWQVQLLRRRQTDLQRERKVLFGFALAIFVGQLVPIAIDTAALVDHSSGLFVIIYAYSNNISAMLAAVLLWWLYLIARSSNNRSGPRP